ncbi:MAG TPA: AAA family ATPase [Candidatus Dojkabacteria bacterium]|nr:AAA family ATPase [Candidatus Dojkabacteria bacterium]
MKIKDIYIKNFRSLKEETIVFPESGILALVGANNAGKSNILKAINNILGDTWFGKDKAEVNDYYNRDCNNNIYIKITFDDNREIELDFLNGGKWAEYKDGSGKKLNEWNHNLNLYNSTGNAKEDFPCTFLPAERSLEKNLQFRSYELMGKIAKSFNEKAKSKKMVIEAKFGEVMELLNEVEGFVDFKNDFVNYFNAMQADTPYKLKVDFKAFSPLNYFKTINILANDSSINSEYDIDIDELGEGNKSLLLFALLRSYAKNFKQDATGILAVEEPEIYLHPQARRHLFELLFEIVKDSNIQIIYTTHSPDFLATEKFDSIGLVSKDPNNGTLVKILSKVDLVKFSKLTGVPADKTTTSNISEFYSTTSNFRLNEGFFAKKLFLVEGETEELCFPILFKHFGINTDSSGISFVAVNGKNQIPKYWRLFNSFGIQTEIVIDNDDDVTGNKRSSNNNIASCFNTSVDEILNIEDNKSLKVLQCNKEGVFNQNIFILKTDFETAFQKDLEKYCEENHIDNKYQNILDEAIDIIKPVKKSQKGQVARFIINRIFNKYPNFKPSFVKSILDNIDLRLGGQSSQVSSEDKPNVDGLPYNEHNIGDPQ